MSPSAKKSRILISSDGIAVDASDLAVALDEDDKEEGLKDDLVDDFK